MRGVTGSALPGEREKPAWWRRWTSAFSQRLPRRLLVEYGRRYSPMQWVLAYENRSCRQLLQTMPAMPGRILDVGCGTGNALSLFEPDGTCFVIDLDVGLLQRVRQSHPVHCVVADVVALPFKSACFGQVTCLGVLEYVSDRSFCLAQLARVLTLPGRAVITSTPKGGLAWLRHKLDRRVQGLAYDDLINLVKAAGLVVQASRRLFSQDQVLVYKQLSINN